MENNLTSYLRLKKTPSAIKQEQDEQDEVNLFQWSADATNLLLKLRFEDERHAKFEDRTISRKELWDEIAMEMQRIGAHQVSGEVCDLKYRNMLHTYKKNRNKELNGADPENISWSYYEIFKRALKSNEERDISQTDDTNDNSQMDVSPYNHNSKRKRTSIKPEIMEIPLTPMLELRAPSARLSNKRLHSNQTQTQHNAAFSMDSFSKSKTNDNNEQRNQQQRALQQSGLRPGNDPVIQLVKDCYTHGNVGSPLQQQQQFELEECRIFGETVGIQLSLIKAPDMRALAEFKIQEILYAAKVSKLKE